MELEEVIVCTIISIVKMKEHLIFYIELSILCIGDRVAVDRVI